MSADSKKRFISPGDYDYLSKYQEIFKTVSDFISNETPLKELAQNASNEDVVRLISTYTTVIETLEENQKEVLKNCKIPGLFRWIKETEGKNTRSLINQLHSMPKEKKQAVESYFKQYISIIDPHPFPELKDKAKECNENKLRLKLKLSPNTGGMQI